MYMDRTFRGSIQHCYIMKHVQQGRLPKGLLSQFGHAPAIDDSGFGGLLNY